MALVNGATCTIRTSRNSSKFLSETEEKKKCCGPLKISGEPGPSWSPCLDLGSLLLPRQQTNRFV